MATQFVFLLLTVLFCGLTNAAPVADPDRQSEVSSLGAEVMPFDLKATTHFFNKTQNGGLQQVIANDPQDQKQIILIRQHLQNIADQFSKGNFSGPTHIHGEEMPGLAELKKARPGEIRINYRDLIDGAELQYIVSEPSLITALHRWIDAQLSDHGSDAMEGEHKHHHMNPQ